MRTCIYMVRHGESLKSYGTERARGLTDKGREDSLRIAELLREEGIGKIVSSPYRRAMETVEPLASCLNLAIEPIEGLKEMIFSPDGQPMADKALLPLVKKLFQDPAMTYGCGESLEACRRRGMAVLQDLLRVYAGGKVVVGTHGMLMTLLLGSYDRRCNLDFLLTMSKPDVYRMEFAGEHFADMARM